MVVVNGLMVAGSSRKGYISIKKHYRNYILSRLYVDMAACGNLLPLYPSAHNKDFF